jgi:hypothetical protein
VSRDAVLMTLVLGLFAPVTWLSAWALGWLPGLAGGRGEGGRSGCELERRRWLGIWLPLVPPAVTLALLVGWALQEPRQTDEILRPLAPLCVVPAALIGLRAIQRAVRALRQPAVTPLAATVGILQPRVVLHPRLRDVLDGPALDAARAHEQAHVRHRDPLRIWLAQLATDLQWPSAAARRRLSDWRNALELARDEEARLHGAAGADLASAVVTVAGLMPPAAPPTALAFLTRAERSLIDRVRRLLAPLSVAPPRVAQGTTGVGSLAFAFGLLATAAVGLAIGFEYGDALVRALPLIVQ